MADQPAKRKAGAKRPPAGVLGTLPASRPERLGRPRGEAPVKPRAAANGAKAAKRAAKRPAPNANATAKGPAPISPGAPPLRAARVSQPPPKPLGAPKGGELVTTAIRAAGELAQLSFTVGGQVLKRTLDRIPRP
jgi:hypothetical protein